MDCLDVEVSIFKNYHCPDNPRTVNLLKWLTSSKYAPHVERIRATAEKLERDKLKANLPAITPSGLFTHRAEAGLVRHSGLIQFDIDTKENAHIANFEDLKREICNLAQVAYCGLSVSGKGFWGLVPVSDPANHRRHFEALKADFGQWGIVLDDKPANVASLRGYSWDPEAYFNPEAMVYTKLSKYSPPRLQISSPPTGSETQKVEACLAAVEASQIDITGSYSDWFAIGCSLANEFGEAGRDYFHRASRFHLSYNPTQADRQFTQCLKHKYRYTIATFFHITGLHGVTYKRAHEDFSKQEALTPCPHEKPGFGDKSTNRKTGRAPWTKNHAEVLSVMKEMNPQVGTLINRLGLEVEN